MSSADPPQIEQFARSLRRQVEHLPDEDLPPARRFVYFLVYGTIRKHAKASKTFEELFFHLLCLFFSMLFAFVLLNIVHIVLSPDPEEHHVADWAVAATSIGLVIAVFLWWYRRSRYRIEFVGRRSVKAVRFARLEHTLNPRVVRLRFVVLGIIMGLQAAFFQHALHLTGVGEFNTEEAFTLAIDNLCYGMLLDTFELYGLQFSARFDHTLESATLFLFFRAALDVVLVVMIYRFLNHGTVRDIIASFPADGPVDLKAVLSWLDETTSNEEWVRNYPDEMIFLGMVRKYITHQDDAVRALARSWPLTSLSNDVAQLFRDQDGGQILDDDL